MLDEGRRRKARGQDVVVGAVQPVVSEEIQQLFEASEQSGSLRLVALHDYLRAQAQNLADHAHPRLAEAEAELKRLPK